MNWVDLTILGVVAISALLAFMRGLVREVLSIGSWVGAGFFAVWAFPFVQDRFRAWLVNPDIADPAAFGAMFTLALLVLSVVASMVGAVVRGSVLGGVDRTLGMAYGVLRGLALVVFVYIGAGLVVTADKWPDPVLQARALPYAYEGAVWVVSLIPQNYRPQLSAPPAGKVTKAEDLMHVAPQGKALATRP
ncbi:MAG: CvpA family protein [Acetobacteraceae bacterium]|nr:CvpA family protein [Acetobacteraceae bacterium]